MARGNTQRSVTAAYVLHSHDWSESSLILDLFTRDHGRVVAVAKGAKRPYSQLRPVLMPFQRLNVAFGAKRSEDAEVWLLRHAEWAGGPAWPGGQVLLPGFYVNELLMKLMVRHEPQPRLFDAYAQLLQMMPDPALLQAALRAFEIIVLRDLGHLPDLSHQTVDGHAVDPQSDYALQADMGVVAARWMGEWGTGPTVLQGRTLIDIESALSGSSGPARTGERGATGAMLPALMAACMPAQGELKSVLRGLIHYHLGSQTLRTRQLMIELQQP